MPLNAKALIIKYYPASKKDTTMMAFKNIHTIYTKLDILVSWVIGELSTNYCDR